MIKYVTTGGPYGDATSRYDVILDKQYTVKEFISAILEQNKDEWGEFVIGEWPSKIKCEFSKGRIKTNFSDEKYLDMNIKSVTAQGGWTFMNYYITIE